MLTCAVCYLLFQVMMDDSIFVIIRNATYYKCIVLKFFIFLKLKRRGSVTSLCILSQGFNFTVI